MLLLPLLLLVPLGCDDKDDQTVGPTSISADLSTLPTSIDLSTPPSTDMATPTAQIRIAQLSPNKPPIDFCLGTSGSSQFSGPLLKPAGVAATGLAYAQVSKYLSVAPGQYDLRIVDGGDTTCVHSLFDATNLMFTAGGSFTVVGTGFIPPNASDPTAYTIAVYTDDTVSSVNSVLLRFIHNAPDVPAVDFGTGSGSNFAALFSNVSYLQAGTSTSPPSDANGYISLTPATPPVTFSLRTHGSSADALTVTSNAALAGGTLATVFAIGDLGGTPKPLQTLVCADNAPPVGPLSACTTLP
jgi:hypothetical protein